MKHNEWDKLQVAAEADAKLHRNNSCDIQSPRCDLKAAILSGNLISRGDNTAISYLSRAERRWICLEAIAPKGALTFRRVYHRCVIFFFSSKCMSPFRPKSPPPHIGEALKEQVTQKKSKVWAKFCIPINIWNILLNNWGRRRQGNILWMVSRSPEVSKWCEKTLLTHFLKLKSSL